MSLYVLYFFAISVLFAFLHLLTKNKKTKKQKKSPLYWEDRVTSLPKMKS